jgi:hypothetical protein
LLHTVTRPNSTRVPYAAPTPKTIVEITENVLALPRSASSLVIRCLSSRTRARAIVPRKVEARLRCAIMPEAERTLGGVRSIAPLATSGY